MDSAMVVEISLSIHMENELRHLNYAIFRLETTFDMSSTLPAVCQIQSHFQMNLSFFGN